MRERIFIYDRSGNLINDPERTVDYPSNLTWQTLYPKGYGSINFSAARTIAQTWAVKNGYEVIVRDGHKIVYQGELIDLGRSMRGRSQMVNLSGAGFINVLARRRLRKPWADYAWPRWKLLDSFTDPNDSTTRDGQQRNLHMWYVQNEGEEDIIFSPKAEYTFDTTDAYAVQYVVPDGEEIRWVKYTVKSYRTGEGFQVALKNDDTGSYEHDNAYTNAVTQTPGTTVTETWTAGNGPSSVTLVVYPATNDIYDDNDFITLTDLQVGTEVEASAGADAVIEDVLVKIGDEISSDYDGLVAPGFDIFPFETLNLGFETGDSIIQRAARYGDGSGNTYVFAVWDELGTSDGLPKAVLEQMPDTNDYEYSISIEELAQFAGTEDSIQNHLGNWVIVQYTDQRNETQFVSPDTDSSLKDDTSIARWGRWDSPVLNIGQSDQAAAIEYGSRFLAFHKDPLPSAEMSIVGEIRNKAGVWVPAGWVRAGERVQLRGWPTPHESRTYVLRETNYDAERALLRMRPGEPQDNLEAVLARRDKMRE